MSFRLDDARAVLVRTPATLTALLSGLPEAWISADEGPGTFSPKDVLGHLIHGERTDWIPRMRRILVDGESRPFDPFDRFAQNSEAPRPVADLLAEFERLRAASLGALDAEALREPDFARRGIHPELGSVTLGQLLSCWVVHDLGHVAQVARVMAKRLAGDVGPWKAYLPVLSDRVRQ